MKNNYSVKELVKGIKKKDNDIFRYIYEKYYPGVYEYIKKNNGNDNDAKDVFQETVIIIYKNIVEGKFEIQSEFYPYLFSISKRIHLKKIELTRKKREIQLNTDLPFSVEEDDTSVNALKSHLLYKHFKKLGEKCQQILSMFAKKVKMDIIAEKLGYSNANSAKKRKHFCQNELIKSIKNDSDYQQILDD